MRLVNSVQFNYRRSFLISGLLLKSLLNLSSWVPQGLVFNVQHKKRYVYNIEERSEREQNKCRPLLPLLMLVILKLRISMASSETDFRSVLCAGGQALVIRYS